MLEIDCSIACNTNLNNNSFYQSLHLLTFGNTVTHISSCLFARRASTIDICNPPFAAPCYSIVGAVGCIAYCFGVKISHTKPFLVVC